MKIFGSIQELVELVYRKGSNTVTLKPNTAQATSITLSLPVLTGDDTVVTNTSTASFSNKTINLAVGGNTISQMTIGSFGQSVGDADKVLLRDVNGTVQHSKIRDVNVDAVAAIALSKLATVTASRALQSDGSGVISASSVTATELGHVSGVTSSIQTQLNAKEPTITVLPVSKGGTNSSTSLNNSRVMISSGSAIVEGSAITASRALASDAGGLPVASTTTSTELGYVSGVTSAVQTQINAKADTSALTAHTGASTGVHGVTGSVVGTTDTQALTNKDIDGGTASNTNRISVPKAAKSVLDGLTRKQSTIVVGSDTNKLYLDDGSTLKEIGSGSSGINYLNSQFNADALGTVEVSVGDTLASTTRANPNQWGNSAASALITQSTDSTLRGTTNYLVAFSANAQFVESPLFSIDGQDLAKPLLVQFDVSGVVTADDVQVYIARYNSSNVLQERILVAGTASATSPNSAQVPTAVTTFRGFFIPSSTATDKYAIRWRRNANNTSMRLDTFIVGPQSLAQAAVVTAWQDFVPTISNFGTVTNLIAKYARVGNTIFVKGSCTAGTTVASAFSISLPSSISFDTTLGAGKQMVGRLEVLKSAAGPNTNAFSDYQALFLDTATNASVVYAAYQNGSGVYVKNTGSGITSSGNSINFEFNAPISQWSSGTTTLADRAVEEYAWNSDTTNTSTTSSGFSNGPDGVQFGSYSTATRTKRVRFQTSILPTDTIILETKDSANSQWMPYHQSRYISTSGTTGMGCNVVSSTEVDVFFASAGYASTVYSPTAAAWSGIAGSDNFKWRVRKVSGGAQVGYPVSARNIVGDTTGTSGPTGMVGELVGGTVRSGTGGFTQSLQLSGSGTWTSGTRYTMGTLTLNKGVYLVCINSSLSGFAAANSADIALFIGGTNVTPNFYYSNPAASGGSADIGLTIPVVISSNSTAVLVSGRSTGVGSPSITVYGEMSVVRIA